MSFDDAVLHVEQVRGGSPYLAIEELRQQIVSGSFGIKSATAKVFFTKRSNRKTGLKVLLSKCSNR